MGVQTALATGLTLQFRLSTFEVTALLGILLRPMSMLPMGVQTMFLWAVKSVVGGMDVLLAEAKADPSELSRFTAVLNPNRCTLCARPVGNALHAPCGPANVFHPMSSSDILESGPRDTLAEGKSTVGAPSCYGPKRGMSEGKK